MKPPSSPLFRWGRGKTGSGGSPRWGGIVLAHRLEQQADAQLHWEPLLDPEQLPQHPGGDGILLRVNDVPVRQRSAQPSAQEQPGGDQAEAEVANRLDITVLADQGP